MQKRIAKNTPVSNHQATYSYSSLYLSPALTTQFASDIGRSATLYDVSDSETTTFTWLSWWKDIRGLQAFAAAATHRLGQTNYDKGKFPHIGIMHETYHAPNGHWETIYDDFAPWGMGQFGLKPSQRGSTMFKRMGKKDW